MLSLPAINGCRSDWAEKLRRRRERERAHRAAETAQEKEERLRKLRLRDRDSSAAQNTEQRQVTLDHVRDCQRQRLSSETDHQREDRLQRTRDSQNRRLSSETEERGGHAAEDKGLSHSQRSISQRPTQEQPYIPLFDQPAVTERRCWSFILTLPLSTVQDSLLVWSSFLVWSGMWCYWMSTL